MAGKGSTIRVIFLFVLPSWEQPNMRVDLPMVALKILEFPARGHLVFLTDKQRHIFTTLGKNAIFLLSLCYIWVHVGLQD